MNGQQALTPLISRVVSCHPDPKLARHHKILSHYFMKDGSVKILYQEDLKRMDDFVLF